MLHVMATVTEQRKAHTMRRNYTSMRGWTYLFGSGQWTGEDAMWARKAKDGAWFVLRFTDLLDAGGKEFEDMPFECDVRRIHLKEIPEAEVDSALRSCGWRWMKDGDDTILVNDQGDTMAATLKAGDRLTLAAVEMCVGYGLGAPLYTATGKRWLHVRAEARREAESLMRDASALDAALDRPVNAIGSTAREYGNGDISSALARGPVTPEKALMRKLQGPRIVVITHRNLLGCTFAIIAPEHYREDGTCKCDDPEHRAMMCKSTKAGGWGYREKDFANIPLRAAKVTP